MTAAIKFYSKQAIAANILKKKGEGFEIIEKDGKWAVVTEAEKAELFAEPEPKPEDEEQQPDGEPSQDGEGSDDNSGDDAGEQEQSEVDMGVNPVGLDRSTTTMKTEKFGRTRYVIQQAQTDGSRKFLPAAGDDLVAWKFHALQFDSAEQAAGYIEGEAGLSVVPFRKAWQETFHLHQKPVTVPEADAGEGEQQAQTEDQTEQQEEVKEGEAA